MPAPSPTQSPTAMKLVGICRNGRVTAYDFCLQPDGSYQHDSVHSAAFECSGATGHLTMLMYTEAQLLSTFPLEFHPDPGLFHLTIFPTVGVEVSCEVECDPDPEAEGDSYDFIVTVDSIVYRPADSGDQLV